MTTKKPPTRINGIDVKADGRWRMTNGDKMITIRPLDEENYNVWEFRVKDGLLLHMIDRNGDIIE